MSSIREEEIRRRKFEEGQKEIGFIVPAVPGVWQLQGRSRQRPTSCTPQWSPAQREKGQLPLDPRRQADVSAAIYADARLGIRYSSECEHLEVSQMSNFALVQMLSVWSYCSRVNILLLLLPWRKVSHRFRNARHEESCSSCRFMNSARLSVWTFHMSPAVITQETKTLSRCLCKSVKKKNPAARLSTHGALSSVVPRFRRRRYGVVVSLSDKQGE